MNIMWCDVTRLFSEKFEDTKEVIRSLKSIDLDILLYFFLEDFIWHQIKGNDCVTPFSVCYL
jgi:hypothetical protein